jgi:hypothetical protein
LRPAKSYCGIKHEKNPDKSTTPGLCELWGMKPFMPHDLRRTASAVAGEFSFIDAWPPSASIILPSNTTTVRCLAG